MSDRSFEQADFREQWDDPMAAYLSCPDCGAVEWGNATCPTCRLHWLNANEEREREVLRALAGIMAGPLGRVAP